MLSIRLAKIALTLAVSVGGGGFFYVLNLPLPWLLGAMTATTAAALAGLPVMLPVQLRDAGLAILGVLLGSGYGPESFAHAHQWLLTLAGMGCFTIFAGAISYFYLHHVAGYSRTTSFFSGMPGGMNEMVIAGTAMGGDTKVIALIHAVRVLITVSLVAAIFYVLDGYTRGTIGGPVREFVLREQALLLLVAVGGAFGGKVLRIPAPYFFGPMLASLIVHTGGQITAAPSPSLTAAAQISIGAALGCRFFGATVADLTRTMRHGMAATLLLIMVTALCAGAMALAVPFSARQIFLAFAPAGIAEMTITALALGYDATFVAVHHLARVVLVFAVAPLLFRVGRRGAQNIQNRRNGTPAREEEERAGIE